MTRGRLFRRKVPQRRQKRFVEVLDEVGNVVYSGRDRRQHLEQVFFDSRLGQRAFTFPQNKRMSKKRSTQLARVSPRQHFLGKPSYPSTRSGKHREKKS